MGSGTSVNDPLAAADTAIPGIIGLAATVVRIVGMINSVNFIDGLDGLSSGIALIAALTLGVISLIADPVEPHVAMFCFALAGALLGFLRWNFHPASIFAGTSGMMFVGYSLAVLSILGAAKVAVARSCWACRSSIRSGSSSAALPGPVARSRPIAATSTIACWTLACRTATRSW